MREIVLDTETTGLSPDDGHRIVEIACLELVNHVPTRRTFRKYVNPERDMPEDALGVHGLSEEFLADKPVFGQVAEEFLTFIGEDPLVIHNAEFDLKFLNAELAPLGFPSLPGARAVDTLAIARQRYPGAANSLDALCKRFEIDNSARTYHGALLDCELLAEVYLELIGGRQPGFQLASAAAERARASERPTRPARPHAASEGELEAHAAMLEKLSDPLWRRRS
ncbi:MAG: DNA polymerase III subunit epsilon [Rhodovibrionaceae bacterium]|nr:DNA polymerase III subunit epsilon [Rhodovibrionaceae bacterium]